MDRAKRLAGIVAVACAFAGLVSLGTAAAGQAARPLDTVDVTLTVANREAGRREAVPVSAGVPFAEGRVTDAGRLRIEQDGREIPAQFLVTARWPDRSVRWVLADFQTDLPGNGSRTVVVRSGATPAAVTGISVKDEPDTMTVDTRAGTFVFAKREFVIRGHRLRVRNAVGTFTAVPQAWTVEEQGPLKTVVRIDGTWREDGRVLENEWVRVRVRLVFFRGWRDVRVFVTLRNNNSFGWNTAGDGDPRRDDLVLTGASFGPAGLLPDGGEYHLGSGVEKTFEVDVPWDGDPRVRVSRFDRDGRLREGDAPMRPMGVAPAAYYASTRAWGVVAVPVTGAGDDWQPDMDRYERLQRSRVDRDVVEDPPGMAGTTLWEHLEQDAESWNDYGDLRWDGNGCGTFSGNHYDWGYGMYLQFMRTGRLGFADAARVLLRHEIDFDVYHTERDSTAFNLQKEWEDRPSHNNPDNCFGGGRPSHTWSQGYALHWLLTGDRRGKDAFDEIQEGVRQYVYESFNGEGFIDTPEIRVQGWLVENLVNRWRIEPDATLVTAEYGRKTLPAAIRDVLRSVFEREADAGGAGFVISDADDGGHVRQTIMHAYLLEPLIKAYDEVFRGRDDDEADRVFGLAARMTRWLMAVTYGGDTTGDGYRPRQIPYWIDTRESGPSDGQTPYVLMVANAAAALYPRTNDEAFRTYAREGFRDIVRYVGVIGPDSYGDASSRTPSSYASSVFTGTESKVQGWLTRYGQFVLTLDSR